MVGIKVAKTHRKDNASLWPAGFHGLDAILRPVEDAVRTLWWATEGAEYQFPAEWILEGSDQGRPDWGPLSGALMRRFDESFVPGALPPVAKPGFLPEFAHVVSGDWSILYGLPDDPTGDKAMLARLGRIDWFAPPTAFPATVSMVIRGIDWAYWELFARDRALITAVYDQVRRVDGLSFKWLEPAPPARAARQQ